MNKKQFKEYIKEIIISEITMVGAKTEPSDAADIAKTERTGIDTVKAAISQAKKTNMPVSVAEMSLNEMAKIAGDLDAAIRKVIEDNPDLEGLPLKKAIKGSEKVKDALDTDELYDNQLNKFIALVRGQRELGKKGRKSSEKADEPKKEEPKAKKEAPKKEAPKKETPKKEKKAKDEDEEEVEDNWNKSSEDDSMEDEKSIDKKAQAAAKKGGGDNTPEEKKIKFNQFLASIQKNKSDKAKVSGLLKIAKDKYELPKTMMDDLLRAAGREVE
jgi:hypothetical protein